MKIKCPLKRIHRGSDFRDFLKEQGILGEVEARTIKQAMKIGGANENQPRIITFTSPN